jgi:hypothetical protein
MVADGGLTATVGSWVDHVRLFGNAGVHPDLFGDVSPEEAQDVASLVATLIELLYTTPAKIAKRQAERRPDAAGALRVPPAVVVERTAEQFGYCPDRVGHEPLSRERLARPALGIGS